MPDPRQRLASPLFVRVVLATFAYFLAIGAMLPTLPLFVRGPLGRGDVGVGAAMAAFAVAAVVLRPFAGRAGDRHGRRLVMVGGALVMAASVAGYAAVGTLAVLLVLRAATGAGEAFFFVGAGAVVHDLAPEHRRGEAVSYFSLGLHGGLALGPVGGELMLRLGGFDAVWLAAGASAAIGALLSLSVGETRPAGHAEHVPLRLVNRSGLVPGSILFFLLLGTISLMTFLPLYARELGLTSSAQAFLLYSGIVLVIRSAGAKLPDVLGFRRAAAFALVSVVAGLLVVAGVPVPAGLYAGTALSAVGHGLAFPALISMAVVAASPAERASVIGTVSIFFDLAFGIGALTSGIVASMLGYRGAFAVASAGGVAGLILLARVGHTRGPSEPEAPLSAPA